MKKMKLFLLCLVAGIMGVKAQMGYQISLLNTATGEPRANETVKVSVSLSNNANEVFYTETKSATTNDFGVLSLSIGNADTFKDVDLSKMPFFIEVTANGVMIGKSQMLSVPVAEVAKKLLPMDKNEIVGTWYQIDDSRYYYTIYPDGTITYTDPNGNYRVDEDGYSYIVPGEHVVYGNYIIRGNSIIIKWNSSTDNLFDIHVLYHYILPYVDSSFWGAGNRTYRK